MCAVKARAEIVVIGSGPGGAITACLLAEAGRDVVLLEEGPALSADSCAPFSLDEMRQKYRNGGVTAVFGNSSIACVEARCAGGGSEINSGLYHRTPPELLDRWRSEYQLADAGASDLEPHFAACERDLSVSYLPFPAPEASLRLRNGAERLGWRAIEVPRWYSYNGSRNGGKRQSMSRTYLLRAKNAGCRMLANTRIRSIRQCRDGWVALGSTTNEPAEAVEVRAESLFICGGAIQTPLLLRRSGFRRNVGDSLQVHPTAKVVALFDREVNDENTGVPVHQVKEFAPQISLGCSVSSRPFLALGLAGYPGQVARLNDTWRRMAVYYAMITPHARGTIRGVPGFQDAYVRLALTPSDYEALAEGLRRLCEALLAAGAIALFPSLSGVEPIREMAQLGVFTGQCVRESASLMTIHLFSSCPMGEDRSKCATDSYGGVHGAPGLYISDASLLCSAPGVNPQGTIMAFARRNALHFLESGRTQ